MWFVVCQRQRPLCCVFTGSWVSVTVSAPLSGPCGCRQRELPVADERKLHFKLRQLHASLAETRANKNVRELNHCSVFFCFPPWRVYVAFSFPVRPLPLTPSPKTPRLPCARSRHMDVVGCALLSVQHSENAAARARTHVQALSHAQRQAWSPLTTKDAFKLIESANTGSRLCTRALFCVFDWLT